MPRRAERRTLLGFGGALLLLLGVGVAAQVTFRNLRESTGLVQHTHQVLDDLDSLNISVLRMGWVQRGYLLSGDPKHLSAYAPSVTAARQMLAHLRSLTGDNPAQQRRLDRLDQLVTTRIASVDTVIQTRQRGGFEAARAIWNDGPGLAQQAEISVVAAELGNAERGLLASRTARLSSNVGWASALVLLGGLASFLLTGLAALLLHRDFSGARRATVALEAANQDLDARVRERTLELERAHHQVRASEERFREVVESLPHLVWTCEPDGTPSYLSPQWVAFTGVDDTAQVGSSSMGHIHPDDRAAVTAAWQHSRETGEPLRIEYRLRRHDGVYHWFDGRGVPLRDADGRIVRWFGSSTDIQEVREARERLAQEQARLATIAAISPAVVHSFRLTPGGQASFPHVAEGIAHLYGLEPAMLRDDAGPALARIHPDDLPRILATIDLSARDLSSYHQRWRVRHPDRGEIWIEGFSTPVREPDGSTIWHGVLIDATERVLAERSLREGEERLQTVIDGLSEGLVVSDLEGQLLHFNPAAITMHGFTSAAEWQLRLPDFLEVFELSLPEGPVLPLTEWPLARVLRGEVLRNWAVRIRRRVGTWERIFNYCGGLVRQPGGAMLAVVTMADITERHIIDLRLQERTRELSRSNRELEQFAYVASHDLREPLRAVAGCVQLLQNRYRGELDARADELIAHSVDGAARMQRLIDDLLEFSRIGTRPPRPEPTDSDAALAEALANLRVAIEECGAVVEVQPMPGLVVDPGQLTSLFQNLIGNALKFRATRAPRISVRALQQGPEWIFSVQDNGIGIESQYFERIFGIFQRLHTRAEFSGTGMGLALCKKIVEQAGGRIWLESVPGEGTTFFFSLPQAPPAAAPAQRTA